MARGRWLSALALGLAISAAASAQASAGVACEWYGLNPGAPVWQGQTILDETYAQALASTGVGALRVDFLIDDQPSFNDTALTRYDAIVDAVAAAGLEPLGLVNYGALAAGQSAWNDDPDGDGMNAYVDAFADVTSLLFARYAGKIRRWEIWNEPNCWSNADYATNPQNAGCSYILPRVYAKLLAETYVRNQTLIAQSGIELVTGGLFAHDIGGSWSPATDYMAEVYANGVWDWMQANVGRRYVWDRFGYHLYVDQGETTTGTKLVQYLDETRALMSQNGDATPFAITEIGWNTDAVSASVQAVNLTTSLSVLEQRSDVAAVYWFSYHDFPGGSWGLIGLDEQPKPAFAALQNATSGCTSTELDAGAGGSAAGAGSSSGGSSGIGTGGGSDSGLGGSSASGGTSGATSAGAAAKPSGSSDSEGCGCRSAARESRSALAAVLGFVLLAARRFARRR